MAGTTRDGSAERLAALIRLAPVGIAELDAAGMLVSANDLYLELTGLTLEQARGLGYLSSFHPDDMARLRPEWVKSIGRGLPYETSVRLLTAAGRTTWVQVVTAPMRSVGDVVGHLATMTDITALREAQARFRGAFEASPLGMALATPDGRIVDANRRLGQLTGVPPEALSGRVFEELLVPDATADSPRVVLVDDAEQHPRTERRLLRQDDATVWVEISRTVLEGSPGLLYEVEDVTARRKAEARVEHLALHDPLTGLPNRLLLVDRVRQALLQAARHNWAVGVLFLDLDRFKAVNDSLGHEVGDQVLREVALRLRSCARQTDTVARLGSDEFVVVCPEVVSRGEVLGIAESLRAALTAPITIGTQQSFVDASIGVAVGFGEDDANVLLRNADQAMHFAKDRGRSRHEVFDEALGGRVQHRVDTESALRGAVDRQEIEAWYQPIVELRTLMVVGSEALVRWRRPELPMVLPGEFITVSEEIGLITEIGSAVLEQACAATAALQDGSTVSVNVSARQFVDQDLGAVVSRVLERTGLPPNRLWLELTESALVQAVDRAARTLQELRAAGVRLAIDDFGSGYSSFEHLRTFEVDLLKIDMNFVRDLASSQHDRAIVEGIVRLADSLGLDVVAEGVETVTQHNLLRELGCRYGQGYLFSRATRAPVGALSVLLPQPRADLPERIARK